MGANYEGLRSLAPAYLDLAPIGLGRLRSACLGLPPHEPDVSLRQHGVVVLGLAAHDWRAAGEAFVAALFAIHPLHVESVAWVSERKDVLSGFFWMLALWAYAGYAERQSLVAYLLVVAAFCLGLMAKAMVVTLPCVLLLMDYWPLGRVGGVQPHSLSDLGGKRKGAGIAWIVLEKAPLFGLAAAASVTTLLAQYDGRLETPPAEQPERIATALRAYQAYLMKTIYPTELMAFYPHPESGSQAWSAGAAASLLGGVTLLVLIFWRRPYLLVGWLWYLGTLVPVIGLVPILGGQSMADRYTYIPLIGIFLALSWGLADLSAWSGLPKWAPAALAALSLLPFAATAWTQVGYWRNSKALWNHVLEVDPDNYVGHHNLGSVLSDEGALDQAVEHLSRAAAANSNGGLSHYALANILAYQGQIDEAIRYYSTALDINPNWPEAHKRLGASGPVRGS